MIGGKMGKGIPLRITGAAFRLAVRKARARNAGKGFCRACFTTTPKGTNICRSRDCGIYGIKYPEIFDYVPDSDTE